MSLEIMARDAAAMIMSLNFRMITSSCDENGNACIFGISVFMTCGGFSGQRSDRSESRRFDLCGAFET